MDLKFYIARVRNALNGACSECHLDNWGLTLKLTDFDFRSEKIITFVVGCTEVTTSKCGVAHSGDVSDLRWGKLLVWGVPGRPVRIASSEASLFPRIAVIVVG